MMTVGGRFNRVLLANQLIKYLLNELVKSLADFKISNVIKCVSYALDGYVHVKPGPKAARPRQKVSVPPPVDNKEKGSVFCSLFPQQTFWHVFAATAQV